MEQREDGGPAFPSEMVLKDGVLVNYLGMTVRDYFAAKALQGFIANKDRPAYFHPDEDAAYCYAIADAMLKQRQQ